MISGGNLFRWTVQPCRLHMSVFHLTASVEHLLLRAAENRSLILSWWLSVTVSKYVSFIFNRMFLLFRLESVLDCIIRQATGVFMMGEVLLLCVCWFTLTGTLRFDKVSAVQQVHSSKKNWSGTLIRAGGSQDNRLIVPVGTASWKRRMFVR